MLREKLISVATLGFTSAVSEQELPLGFDHPERGVAAPFIIKRIILVVDIILVYMMYEW